MEYLFEYNKYKHLDPYDEEDWDEKETDVYTIYMAVAPRDGSVEIKAAPCFLTIRGSRLVVNLNVPIFQTSDIEGFNRDIDIKGLVSQEKYLIFSRNMVFDQVSLEIKNIDIIRKGIERILKSRKNAADERIDRNRYLLRNDGYDEDNDESYDTDELYEELEREKNIQKNIINILGTLQEIILDRIKNDII